MGSQSQDFATAQEITLDGLYYGYRPSRPIVRTTTSGERNTPPWPIIKDYYKFVVE
jgi:hypothetical protein